MNRNTLAFVVALVAVGLTVSLVFLWRRPGQAPIAQAVCGNAAPAYWYDPMHPSEHFNEPGKSPFMDMQLAPKCPESTPASPMGTRSAGAIEVDPRVVQNLGLRLASVEQGSFSRSVDTVGLVGVDEHRIEVIQVREPGWVEQLNVRAVGDPVRRGRQLAGIYSPDLLAIQHEFIIAREANDPKLTEAARGRLALFGLSSGQIAHIEKTGRAERLVLYYAPFDGYVMDLGVRQGAAVQPGATLFQIADLATVWVTAEVPELQAGWINPGNPAEVTAPALPGARFDAQIDYLYPELTQTTRTLKVRVVVKNSNRRLRPGMFASVHLSGAALEQVLTVPTEAVIRTGTRSVVILAEDATHFRPTVVRVGAEQGGRSQILEGVGLGQTVVASGQFLIDSEASLRGAFDNLAGAGEAKPLGLPPDQMPAPSVKPPDGGR
jgi:Cu(I)/Ag(I) efflux system membrane fusion protein